MFHSSNLKSSSLVICPSKSSTSSRGRITSMWGSKRSIRPAMLYRIWMSRRTVWSMAGRRTFRATASPPGSTARCTCAMDADAAGVSSNVVKTSPSGRPSSSSTISTACSAGNGGTRSWSFSSSTISSPGRRSRRLLMIWASLMYVGPSSSKTIRTCSQRL